MADENTSNTSVLNIGASVEGLIKMREDFRSILQGYRNDAIKGNADLLRDQASALSATEDADKASWRNIIANARQAQAELRQNAAEAANEIRKLSDVIPKNPLKVSIEGVNAQAIQVLRDEFGTLLGPLNGITGRISSIIGLMKVMGQVGKEGGEEAFGSVSKLATATQVATNAGQVLANLHTKIAETTRDYGQAAETTGAKVGNLAANIAQVAVQSGIGAAATAKLAASAAEAGAGAAEAAEGLALTAASLAGLLPIAVIAVTTLAAVGAASFAAGKGLAEEAHQYDLLGQRVGTSAKEIRGLSLAAQVGGIPVEGLITSLQRLDYSLAGRGTGGGTEGKDSKVQETIELLIGKITDGNGVFLSTVTILEKLADRFKSFPDGPAKSALAIQIFNRGGTEMIPIMNGGSASIREFIDEANRMGANLTGQSETLKAYNKATSEAGLAWQTFKESLADAGVFEIATDWIGKLTKAIIEFRRMTNEDSGKTTQNLKDLLISGAKNARGDAGPEVQTSRSKAQLDAISEFAGTQTKEYLANKPYGMGLIDPNELSLTKALFPNGEADKIRASIVAIAGATNQVADATERTKAYNEQIAGLRDKLTHDGVIELNQDTAKLEAAKKQAELDAVTITKGGNSVDAYKKAYETVKREIELSDAKLARSGKKAFEDPNILKQRDALLAEAKSRADIKFDPANVPQIREFEANAAKYTDDLEKLKELNSALGESASQSSSKAKEMQKQFENSFKEIVKAHEATLLDIEKQASPSQQIATFTAQLGIARKASDGFLDTITNVARGTKGAADAIALVKSALAQYAQAQDAIISENTRFASSQAALQEQLSASHIALMNPNLSPEQRGGLRQQEDTQQQAIRNDEAAHQDTLDQLSGPLVNANKQVDTTMESLSNLAPKIHGAFQAAIDAVKGLGKSTAETEKVIADLTHAQGALDEATKRSAKSFDDLAAKSGELTKKIEEQKIALGQVGERDQTLSERTAASIAAMQSQADEISRLNQELLVLASNLRSADAAANANPGNAQNQNALISATNQYNDKLQETSEAYRKQTETAKQLVAEQDELKRSTKDLSKVWGDFKDILEGFGVGMPKQVVQIERMVESFKKLTLAIKTLNDAHKATQELNKAGIGTGKEGEPTTGQKVAALSKVSPEVQKTQDDLKKAQDVNEPLRNALSLQKSATDANTGAIQGLTGAVQAGGVTGQQPISGLATPAAAPVSSASDASAAASSTVESQPPLMQTGGTVVPAPPVAPVGLLGGAEAAAAPIGLGAGIGGMLGGALGGGMGKAGGEIAGAGLGAVAATGGLSGLGIAGMGASLGALAPVLTVAGPVGLAIGAVLVVMGMVNQKAQNETAKVAKKITDSFNAATKAFQDGGTSLVQTIKETTALVDQATGSLAGRTGGHAQLDVILPPFYQAIAQLKAQQAQILTTFNLDVGTLRFPLGVQSTAQQLEQLNQQITTFINAGGSANEAAEMLARSLAAIKTSTTTDLLNTEQGVVSLLLQQIQLRQQAGQAIQSEAQQEQQILNQGVISRTRSIAQDQATQILALRQQRDQTLEGLNEQLASNKAQIGNAQEMFGLTTDQNALLQKQLSIQMQLTDQTNQQTASQIQLLGILQQIKPGGTQADLNSILAQLGGAMQIPGLPQPTPGKYPGVQFDSSAFLVAITSLHDGVTMLQKYFKGDQNIPATLSQAQEQALIAYIQKSWPTYSGIVPTLQNIMQQEVQSLTVQQSQLPGGGSGLGTATTPTSQSTAIPSSTASSAPTLSANTVLYGTDSSGKPIYINTQSGNLYDASGNLLSTTTPSATSTASFGTGTAASSLTQQVQQIQVANAQLVTIGQGAGFTLANASAAIPAGTAAATPSASFPTSNASVSAASSAAVSPAAATQSSAPPVIPPLSGIPALIPGPQLWAVGAAEAQANVKEIISSFDAISTDLQQGNISITDALDQMTALQAQAVSELSYTSTGLKFLSEMSGQFTSAISMLTAAVQQGGTSGGGGTTGGGTTGGGTTGTGTTVFDTGGGTPPAVTPGPPGTATIDTTSGSGQVNLSLNRSAPAGTVTGQALPQAEGLVLFGTDANGAAVYINPQTGRLYGSQGEPLSPSEQVNPLVSSGATPSGTAAAASVGTAVAPTPTFPTPPSVISTPPVSVTPPSSGVPPVTVAPAPTPAPTPPFDAAAESAAFLKIVTGQGNGIGGLDALKLATGSQTFSGELTAAQQQIIITKLATDQNGKRLIAQLQPMLDSLNAAANPPSVAVPAPTPVTSPLQTAPSVVRSAASVAPASALSLANTSPVASAAAPAAPLGSADLSATASLLATPANFVTPPGTGTASGGVLVPGPGMAAAIATLNAVLADIKSGKYDPKSDNNARYNAAFDGITSAAGASLSAVVAAGGNASYCVDYAIAQQISALTANATPYSSTGMIQGLSTAVLPSSYGTTGVSPTGVGKYAGQTATPMGAYTPGETPTVPTGAVITPGSVMGTAPPAATPGFDTSLAGLTTAIQQGSAIPLSPGTAQTYAQNLLSAQKATAGQLNTSGVAYSGPASLQASLQGLLNAINKMAWQSANGYSNIPTGTPLSTTLTQLNPAASPTQGLPADFVSVFNGWVATYNQLVSQYNAQSGQFASTGGNLSTSLLLQAWQVSWGAFENNVHDWATGPGKALMASNSGVNQAVNYLWKATGMVDYQTGVADVSQTANPLDSNIGLSLSVGGVPLLGASLSSPGPPPVLNFASTPVGTTSSGITSITQGGTGPTAGQTIPVGGGTSGTTSPSQTPTPTIPTQGEVFSAPGIPLVEVCPSLVSEGAPGSHPPPVTPPPTNPLIGPNGAGSSNTAAPVVHLPPPGLTLAPTVPAPVTSTPTPTPTPGTSSLSSMELELQQLQAAQSQLQSVPAIAGYTGAGSAESTALLTIGQEITALQQQIAAATPSSALPVATPPPVTAPVVPPVSVGTGTVLSPTATSVAQASSATTAQSSQISDLANQILKSGQVPATPSSSAGSGGGLTVGTVSVTIQGSTNMTSAQVQQAVTEGLNASYLELLARRGAVIGG